MTGTIVFWVIVAILVIAILYAVGIYNALVGLRNQVKNAWSQIDVQLKRRHDLIPNLVETARGYMKHERETFENVTRARSDATGARGVPQIAQAESRLTEAISRF
ncbi:MAG TPA: LemA family protein, partial [Deltaproteobacteria bacterium]|nr:LemA family protein [Deltaproteobacteria bacterium]